MGKAVTSSFSTKYVNETFNLKDIEFDENMGEEVLQKAVEEFFHDWVWRNVSFSYIIEEK
ncbi:hypothetical protein [Metabacillus niabensis]|uniref:Uncharacterized protein n=1 Tax=Metabacillus niabensis TaxID=324854 RepID=A0ABT9Z6E4_9BACI|nr:hypothetical protein [Metabacillus niabensis]MDQ0227819.1 hypothetical protein [Metabacillus niabensis]